MRNWKDALQWLNSHNDSRSLGFNPDGRCLQIAREARGIGSKYPSARVASENTPREDRVYNIKDLRAGMVLYFDDPRDDNPYGHIVTLIGRKKGGDRNLLSDTLVVTNSVQSGKLTVVAGNYFSEHWGDPFVFGAKSLNGVKLDWAGSWNDNQAVVKESALEQFTDGGPKYHVGLLDAAAHKGNKTADNARKKILTLVRSLPDDGGETRVSEFKSEFLKTRVLRMGLLSEAVHTGGREGVVKDVYDQLNELIQGLPHH